MFLVSHWGCDRQSVGVTGEAAWPPPGMSFGEVPVLGSHLAFVAGGSGDMALFLHGNPTSSFLWRRVLPGLTGSARCVAVDLIGMGRSGKPAIGYGFAGHAAYLEAFADQLGLRGVTVVGHDWGAVLGLDLLRRRPGVVGRIAVCEGHLHPFRALGGHGSRGRASCSPGCARRASASSWCSRRTSSSSRSCPAA
jgi:pimeloyl-ACP methyl ester carboxylesterase